jgi:hypothetical protein
MRNFLRCWHRFHCRIFPDFRHGISPSENDWGGLTVSPTLTLYIGGKASAGADGKPAGGGFPGESLPGDFSRKFSR